MIKVQFFVQDMRTGEVLETNEVFFSEIGEAQLHIIDAQRNVLGGFRRENFLRIFCLIENVRG